MEANFETCSTLASAAASQGCSILFLPECFAYIGIAGNDALAVMEPLDGPLMARYRQLAKDTGVWLSLGGFPETGPDADHRYNTHVLVDSDGDVRASYRKIHLFDVDIPNGPVLMESKTASPGDAIVAADSPIGRLGMTVCYDLRFPELYSRLRHEMGAQIMLVPSAFTKPTGEAHWEVLLRARAIETQSYVIAAAQAPDGTELARVLEVRALDEFVAATHRALSRTCAARVADSALRLAEVGQAGVGPLATEATAHWLAQLEAANDVVILKADPFPSRWCVTCARHADAILLVAAAEDDDAPGPHEGHALQARLLGGVHGGGLAQRELVLLHNSTDVMPAGTRPWLEAVSVHRHHHIARAPAHGLAPAHAARLARSLRRQSVGLVLAG